jgi:hypothetical protein
MGLMVSGVQQQLLQKGSKRLARLRDQCHYQQQQQKLGQGLRPGQGPQQRLGQGQLASRVSQPALLPLLLLLLLPKAAARPSSTLRKVHPQVVSHHLLGSLLSKQNHRHSQQEHQWARAACSLALSCQPSTVLPLSCRPSTAWA